LDQKNFKQGDVIIAYRVFCKDETSPGSKELTKFEKGEIFEVNYVEGELFTAKIKESTSTRFAKNEASCPDGHPLELKAVTDLHYCNICMEKVLPGPLQHHSCELCSYIECDACHAEKWPGSKQASDLKERSESLLLASPKWFPSKYFVRVDDVVGVIAKENFDEKKHANNKCPGKFFEFRKGEDYDIDERKNGWFTILDRKNGWSNYYLDDEEKYWAPFTAFDFILESDIGTISPVSTISVGDVIELKADSSSVLVTSKWKNLPDDKKKLKSFKTGETLEVSEIDGDFALVNHLSPDVKRKGWVPVDVLANGRFFTIDEALYYLRLHNSAFYPGESCWAPVVVNVDSNVPDYWIQVGDADSKFNFCDIVKPNPSNPANMDKPSEEYKLILMRLPTRCKCIDILIEQATDGDLGKRKAKAAHLLKIPIVEKILRTTHTVGPWLTRDLVASTDSDPILDYLLAVCRHTDISPHSHDLIQAFSGIDELLPQFLKLNSSQKEEIACSPLVVEVLNVKLEESVAFMFILGDFIMLCIWVYLYTAIVHSRTIIESATAPYAYLLGLGINVAYFTLREFFQFTSCQRIKCAYFSDLWNINDLLAISLTYAVIILAAWSGQVRASNEFRVVAAIGNIFVWMKFIGYVKLFNQKLAAYVYALEQIIVDLAWFLIIMFIAVVMFSSAFYVLNGQIDKPERTNLGIYDVGDDDLLSHNKSPFRSGFLSMFGMYVMILGFFDTVWLEDDRSALITFSNVCFFMLFTFMVVIIMLNVLIAVVSDSYDGAVTKSRRIFYRARLEKIAEIDSFITDMRRSINMYDPAFVVGVSLWLYIGIFFFGITVPYIMLFVITSLV